MSTTETTQEAEVRCKRCGKPVIRCDSLPGHGGCSSAHGWIHATGWVHECRTGPSGRYAYPADPRPILSPLTLDAIQAEATRAHLKHGEHSMLGPRYSSGDRLAILMEEVGEVAHELTYDQNDGGFDARDRLVKELIQVAAMAATWIEYLEGDAGETAP